MEETNMETNSFNHETTEFPKSEGKSDPPKLSKCSRRVKGYGNTTARRNRGKRYPLRSSFRGTRVLRSASKKANVTSSSLKNAKVDHVQVKSKRIKKTRRPLNDEFLRIRRSVRYLLHRVSYEQSLIDAYAGEGWKGQSSEKIKPEMELQRAKSEILRCKLKIRNIFQQIDASIAEGKLDDSLFDTKGEIYSEDIFCSKCRCKDVSTNNDIILCDGICDRGFHQLCVDPPLLKVPPGDESWLCPGCDCKVDCLDLINEMQGTDLSIDDDWEKVFPESSAFASKSAEDNDFELPSDDSEDDDYNPDHLEADEEAKEGSSSYRSDFSAVSEDSDASDHGLHVQDLGLPSDDSEDVDYDPERLDIDDKAAEGTAGSDESDFTSDTDDLNVPENYILEANETSVSPMSNYPSSFRNSGKGDAGTTNKSSVKSTCYSLERELGHDSSVHVSGKRHCERLDYKNLYDEAYGNELSDSTDDEAWKETTTRNFNEDVTRGRTEGPTEIHAESVERKGSSKGAKGTLELQNTPMCTVSADIKETEIRQIAGDQREAPSVTVNHFVDKLNPDSTDLVKTNFSEKTPRCFLKCKAAGLQKLRESFRENQYPNRKTKECLARDVGMTLQQVNTWFANTRRKTRVSGKEGNLAGPSSSIAPGRSEGSVGYTDIQEEVITRRLNRGRLWEGLDGLHGGVAVSTTENGSKGSVKTEKAVQEQVSREILLMRELRKRRLSK